MTVLMEGLGHTKHMLISPSHNSARTFQQPQAPTLASLHRFVNP